MAFRFRPLLTGAAVAALSLSGCNKIGLVYEYADKLVRYNVEDNFDLDKAQRARLKDDVEAYFHWHRKQLLPEYANFLKYVADSLRDGLRPAEVDSGYKRYKALYRMTMEPVAEKSLALLEGLTPEQVDGWMEKQHKKNEKLRKDFSGTLPERLDHRYKKIIDEMEDWTGRLTKEQRARIKVLNASLPWNGGLWLDLKEKVEEHLAGMLKQKAASADVKAYLDRYYLHTDSLRSEEFRAKNKEFETRLCTLIYMINNTLTTEQKRRFIAQVDKLAQDFRVMSQQE